MDWTFWVGAVVIVGLLIATQVFLHESRWSRRHRPEDDRNAEPMVREEPDLRDESSGQGPPPQDGDTP
ncbi:MAG TPA: hypothetical protein VFS72_06530 [Agromyces sp.]|jgi:hypothetical protein|nr:hypothetical protein [Agromyces sp.]